MKKTFTKEKVIDQFKKVHGDKYDYSLVDYEKMQIPVKIICPDHGIFMQKPYSHKTGHGCIKCKNKKPKKSLESVLEEFKKIHGDKYDYSLVEYKGTHKNVTIICDVHGKFLQTPSAHKSGRGCQLCGIDKNSKGKIKSQKSVIADFEEIHNNKYDYSLVDYVKTNENVKIICPDHGVFEQMPYSHKAGHGCPNCFSFQSKNELEILNSIDLDFETNLKKIIPSNRRLEIDLLNREHMVSIEFNGVYWHQIHTDKLKDDLLKAEEMRDLGYKHFALDETDMVKLGLLNKMINPNKTKLYARKLELKVIKNPKEFLDENHLQGSVRAKVSYGLFLNDELIQTMTFGKSRFDQNIDWEILRLCTKPDYLVVGGAERLFKAFMKEYNPKTIVSYSDNKYFDGKVYGKLGMKFVENTAPNYVWWKNGISLKRYQTMKHKLKNILGDRFDPDLTEKENMISNGWIQIKDLGNKKWAI